MPSTPQLATPTSKTPPPHWQLVVALALVYVVWGTTYFALGVAVKQMPPITMNASRFLLAGVLMIAWARWQGLAWPTREQWRNTTVVGVMMVFCAMNLITFAQKNGIGSGVMATVITTMPMWLALWTQIGGERVPRSSWIGLGLGVGGAVLLAHEGDFSASPISAICAFGGPLCWSLGSYASRRLSMPSTAMASGAQWLIGGTLGMVLAVMLEQPSTMFDAPPIAWVAWVYLLVLGTMIALTAYLWLLQHASPALAGSYAFVNPAVALAIGVLIGGEHLTGSVWLALPMIFAALALIMYGRELAAWAARLKGSASWGKR